MARDTIWLIGTHGAWREYSVVAHGLDALSRHAMHRASGPSVSGRPLSSGSAFMLLLLLSQVRPRWPLGPRDERSRTQAQQLSKRKQPRPGGADGANKRANTSAPADRAIDGAAPPSGC